ncbi:MAG: hypothetical protein ACD_48C00090G0005 [uncultured bacterium]|nr:MAG: hypothetical protein ACD_48C00090G0005 [uncultured bacterium]
MKHYSTDFASWKKHALQDPKFKAEYEKQQPEFAVIKAIIEARIKNDMTQKEVAKKIGTKQSVISRLESGRGNPTLSFLKKMAVAFSSRLEIRFVQ